jgi:hypothetical protein
MASGRRLIIRLVLQMIVKWLGLFEFWAIKRLKDVAAMLVLLLRYVIDVDAGGGCVPVAERLLRLRYPVGSATNCANVWRGWCRLNFRLRPPWPFARSIDSLPPSTYGHSNESRVSSLVCPKGKLQRNRKSSRGCSI